MPEINEPSGGSHEDYAEINKAYSSAMPPGCFVRFEPRVESFVIYGKNGKVVLGHRSTEEVEKWSGEPANRRPFIFASIARRSLLNVNKRAKGV